MKKLLFSLLVVTMNCTSLFAASLVFTGSGSSVPFVAQINLASAVAAGVGHTVIVSSPVTVVNLTVPPTVALKVVKGGSITYSGVLIINGRFEGVDGSLLKSGSGTLAFGTGALNSPFSPTICGAVGDGTTADTVPVQTSLTAIAGVAPLDLAKGKSYRLTAPVTWSSNTTIQGEGELYLDYTATHPGIALGSSGSIGSAVLLTGNAAAADLSIDVASVSGLSVGSMVALYDTRWSNAYPVQILKIGGISGTTLTFDSPIGIPYTTANAAAIKLITPLSNITLKDFTIRASAASNLEGIVQLNYIDGVRIDNVKVKNHGCALPLTIGTAAAFTVTYSNDVMITNCIGKTTRPAPGAFIDIETSQGAHARGNTSDGYAFGVEAVNCFKPSIIDNTLSADTTIGVRGTKFAGVINGTISGNRVSGFATGIKSQDSAFNAYTGNILSSIGGNYAINIGSNVSGDANACQGNIVTGGMILNTGSYGIFTDIYAPNTVISGVNIATTATTGIYAQAPATITGNNIFGYGTAGIAFTQGSAVTGNSVFTSNAALPSFTTLGSAFQASNYTVFSGNQAYANPIDSSKIADFRQCSVENSIAGFGRSFQSNAVPSSGAWLVGDVVRNVPPVVGQPKGWRCTVSGTPGVWVSEGNL